MATTAALDPPVDDPKAEEAKCQAITQHYLDEIIQVNQAMVRDQEEIEQLQADTRRILADMQAILLKIEAR